MIEEPRIEDPRDAASGSSESDLFSGPAGREDIGLDEIDVDEKSPDLDEDEEDEEIDEEEEDDEDDEEEEEEEEDA